MCFVKDLSFCFKIYEKLLADMKFECKNIKIKEFSKFSIFYL